MSANHGNTPSHRAGRDSNVPGGKRRQRAATHAAFQPGIQVWLRPIKADWLRGLVAEEWLSRLTNRSQELRHRR